MKTINNMKAMEMNEEMLEQVNGGAYFRRTSRKEVTKPDPEPNPVLNEIAVVANEPIADMLTLGLYSAVKSGLQVYNMVASIGLGA